MWEKRPKKCIFLLKVDNYDPQICQITYPLIYKWARKIGAEVFEIKERKFPGWPPVYEKLQIYELSQQMGNDWNIYIDSDTLIHPDTMDITEHLPKDTVCHNGNDMADNRWSLDRYFRRDGRHIGSCNWFTVASDWCIELWKPLDDLTLEQALENIHPTVNELNTVVTKEHLIDDYTLSRNIAKYGLKFMTVLQVNQKYGFDCSVMWHQYTMEHAQKIQEMGKVLRAWRVI